MAKFNKGETIAYLKTLKEGDHIVAVSSEYDYTAGRKYELNKDDDGDLCVENDMGNHDFVFIGNDYEACVYGLIEDGVFALPEDVGYVAIGSKASAATFDERTRYSVVVNVDDAGYAALIKLEQQSTRAEELAQLYETLTTTQAKIDELEAAQ